MNNVEIVMVPRSKAVVDLMDDYAQGVITYQQLAKAFDDRGWSTLSLWENTRHITPKKLDEAKL